MNEFFFVMQKNRLKESNNNDNSNNGKQVLKNSTFLNVSYIYSLRSNTLIPYCGKFGINYRYHFYGVCGHSFV